jgi:hypothetical protein
MRKLQLENRKVAQGHPLAEEGQRLELRVPYIGDSGPTKRKEAAEGFGHWTALSHCVSWVGSFMVPVNP